MEQCLFCLEETTEENVLIQLDFQRYYDGVACNCRVITHVACWMNYFIHKGFSECPICHKIYFDQPQPQRPQVSQIPMYIVENPLQTIIIDEDEYQRNIYRLIMMRVSLCMICSFMLMICTLPFVFYISK